MRLKRGEVETMKKMLYHFMRTRNEYTEMRKQEKLGMKENKNKEKRARWDEMQESR